MLHHLLRDIKGKAEDIDAISAAYRDLSSVTGTKLERVAFGGVRYKNFMNRRKPQNLTMARPSFT